MRGPVRARGELGQSINQHDETTFPTTVMVDAYAISTGAAVSQSELRQNEAIRSKRMPIFAIADLYSLTAIFIGLV